MSIEVERVSKNFGSFAAVKDVSLVVEEGSLSALLGPSGSGKTTVLRMIAGLETPDSGRITINGNDVSNVAAQKRNVGFVFQHYALFKHMRVGDNIAFPLKVRKWKRSAIRERVSELLHLLKLESLESRYPDQISGGQRQRVALARALASRPQVLLLDEPFAALDARVRDDLREWLRSLHEQLHVTSLFVTHDQSEAMELADTVIVMNEGQVVQAGTPREIIHEPNSPFVMKFVGGANALDGTAQHGVADIQGLQVPYESADGAVVPVTAYFRQQHVHLSASPVDGALPARVQRLLTTGVSTRLDLVVEGTGATFVAEVPDLEDVEGPVEVGTRLYARPSALRIFPRESTSVADPELVDVTSS